MDTAINVGQSPVPGAESFVRCCIIKVRSDERNDYLFRFDNDGRVTVKLDGYAVVPLEDYPGNKFWPRIRHAFRTLAK